MAAFRHRNRIHSDKGTEYIHTREQNTFRHRNRIHSDIGTEYIQT